MLTDASHYRYIANPGPVAAGIHNPPHIVPVRDGTAAACIETYEDYCYLVEMARERHHWSYGGDPDPYAVSGFDPALVTEDKDTLDSLSALALDIDDASAMSYYSGTIVPVDWTEPAYPLVKNHTAGEGYALDAWRATMRLSRVTPSRNAPLPLKIDSLRYFYRDFGNMSRYMFGADTAKMNQTEFEALTDYSGYPHVVGGVMQGNRTVFEPGNPDRQYSEAVAPWVSESWRSGTSDGLYGCEANFSYYIRSPFCLDPSATRYYQSVQVYLSVGCDVSWGTGPDAGSATVTAVFKMVPASVATVSGLAGLEGVVSLQFPRQAMKSLLLTPMNSWCENNIAGYSAASVKFCGVTVNSVYFDTGAIEHVSNIPPSWDWQPS